MSDESDWMMRTALSMARSVCGVRFRHQVEDAQSEALLEMCKMRDKFPDKGRGEMAVAAKRAAVRFLKRMCGERFQRAALVETLPFCALDNEDDQEDHALASHDPGMTVVVDDAGFEGLLLMLGNERDRRMIRAWMQERVCQEEIGRREGISQGEVSKTLGEALAEIRLRVEDDEELTEIYAEGGAV